MKVLIVDDKPENLYLLELILKGSGYITVSAKNGEEALSLARKDIPDLIISDILMPVMDGFTLCRELKKDEKLRCIPFIFYTATYTDVKDEEFALSLGADKFILKPQDPEEFIANIKTVLKEAGEKNIQKAKAPSTPEAVILKEYNEALVRKLEDKMLQAEQSEKEIRKYNILLLKEIEERKHKEVLLRESERQISLIYDTVGDVIFNLKVEGKGSYIFTSVNQCFFKTTGLQANQIIGKRVHEIIPEPSLTLVLEKYAEAIRERKILRWEETSLYPTGELIGEVSIAPVFDDALNCISLVGSVHDITERKRTEEALIASEHLFQTLAIVSPVGVFRTHHDGYTTYVNPKWCQISGLSSDDALGFGWLKAVHPDDREKLSNEWQESTKDHKASYSEYRFLHSDGTITWVMGQAIPETNSENQIVGYVGTITDITERKVAEEALFESEEKYRTLVTQSPDGIFILDLSGSFISVNKSMCDQLKYTEEELYTKKLWDLVPQQYLILHKDRLANILKGEKVSIAAEYEVIGKDGIVHSVEVLSAPYFQGKKIIGLQGIARDITERKRTEEKIREKDIQFRKLSSNMPDLIFQFTRRPDGTYCVPIASKGIKNIFGCSPEDVLEDFAPIAKVIFPEDASRVISEIEYSAKHLTFFTCEFRVQIPGKSIQWIYSNSTPEKLPDGSITWYGFNTDITARKHAEEEITMLAHSLRSINECVSITDIENKILFVNESFLKTYSYNKNELVGKHISIINSLNNPTSIVKEILPSTIRGEWQGELWNKRKDGTEFPVYLSTTTIYDKDSKPLGLIGVAIDITERKRAEKELIDAKEKAELSDKLKSEFLAQMSHEIRTPLNAIVGNVDYLKDAFSEKVDLDTRESFDSIDLSSKRIIRTVDLILNVAEFQTSGYEPHLVKVDLNSEVLKKLYEEHLLLAQKKGLELIYKCEVKEVKVLADEYSITQTFANLIDNAIKYTKKGKVEILLKKNKNDNIIVEIKDTGIGISKEFRKQLFKPFVQEEQGYTRSYDGSGLGLTLVKNYCDINKAIIEVESEKNVGSTFRIIFNK